MCKEGGRYEMCDILALVDDSQPLEGQCNVSAFPLRRKVCMKENLNSAWGLKSKSRGWLLRDVTVSIHFRHGIDMCNSCLHSRIIT